MAIGSNPIGGDSGAGSTSIDGGGGGSTGGHAELCDRDNLAPMKELHKLGFFDQDTCCCPCTSFADDFSGSGSFATVDIDPAGVNNSVRYTAVTVGLAGNNITIAYVDPALIDQILSVSVAGNSITVSLATDGAGLITSTADLIIAAIIASVDASALVTPTNIGLGTAVVTAIAATNLAGGADSLASYYVQKAGSWSATSQHVETTDANAILYLCTDREALNWAVSADVSGTQNGDTLRLSIGGHGVRVAAEVEFNSGGGTLRLIGADEAEVDSVSVTAVPSTTYRLRIGSTSLGTVIFFGAAGSTLDREICALTPGVYTNSVSLETGALTGTATFNNLVVEERGTDDCPNPCILNSDKFDRADGDPGSDWSQDSGTWAISNNAIVTSDAGALLSATANQKTSSSDYNCISADVTASADGDQVILGLHALSSTLFVKLEFQAGANNGTLTVSISGSADLEAAVTAIPGETYNLKCCYVLGKAPAPVFAAFLDGVAIVAHELTSFDITNFTSQRLETGTVTGQVQFNNVLHEIECGACPPPLDCSWPLLQPVHQIQLKVTISGHTGDEAAFNGEYILDNDSNEDVVPANLCCLWRLGLISIVVGSDVYDRIQVKTNGPRSIVSVAFRHVSNGEAVHFTNQRDVSCLFQEAPPAVGSSVTLGGVSAGNCGQAVVEVV